MPPVPRKSGIRKERHALLYDVDYGNQQKIIRIDIIIEDGVTNIVTPITASYQARFVAGNPSAIPKRDFEPRTLTCCFSYQDVQEVTRSIYNPYTPSNNLFLMLVKELISYNGVVSLEYSGESKDKGLELWLS